MKHLAHSYYFCILLCLIRTIQMESLLAKCESMRVGLARDIDCNSPIQVQCIPSTLCFSCTHCLVYSQFFYIILALCINIWWIYFGQKQFDANKLSLSVSFWPFAKCSIEANHTLPEMIQSKKALTLFYQFYSSCVVFYVIYLILTYSVLSIEYTSFTLLFVFIAYESIT